MTTPRPTTARARSAGLSPTVLFLAAFALAGGGTWILTSTSAYEAGQHPTPAAAAASKPSTTAPTTQGAHPAAAATAARSTGVPTPPAARQTIHPPAPATQPQPTSPTQQIDPLAGPLTDQQLQQLMNGSYPCALRTAQADEAVQAAWAGLQGDLLTGGWTEVRMQAGVACLSPSPTADPGGLQVMIMWAGSRPVTGPTDRQLAVVEVSPHADGWQVRALT